MMFEMTIYHTSLLTVLTVNHTCICIRNVKLMLETNKTKRVQINKLI